MCMYVYQLQKLGWQVCVRTCVFAAGVAVSHAASMAD